MLLSHSSELNTLHQEYGQNRMNDNEKGGAVVPLSYTWCIYRQYSTKHSFTDCILATPKNRV
jgi:hypothetical protein